jgi:hypothetical protein
MSSSAPDGCDGDNEPMEGWYLDTDASSHMIRRADSFLQLDRVVQRTVQFGDGSVVPIDGREIVTFLDKNRGDQDHQRALHPTSQE